MVQGIVTRVFLTGVALCSLLISFSTAQEEKGSVCVASRADDPWWKVPPPASTNTRGFKVRIDKRPAVAWPAKQSLNLDDLGLEERHLIVAIDASGKPVESVRFRFSDYKSNRLCMMYDGYQGMQLQEATRHTPWCKCK
jgi:hypothetical protein